GGLSRVRAPERVAAEPGATGPPDLGDARGAPGVAPGGRPRARAGDDAPDPEPVAPGAPSPRASCSPLVAPARDRARRRHGADGSPPACELVSVFGLGHVGCVTAACLARAGHDVIGVDVSRPAWRWCGPGRRPWPSRVSFRSSPRW